MQIHEQKHKSMVSTIPKGFRVRVFYSSTSARQTVLNTLLAVSSEMVDGYAERQRVIDDPDCNDHEVLKLALSRFMWELEDPTVTCLDEYAPKSFGVELSMRLFWEACVVRQSIVRGEGSKYETGRPSAPAFQDMNISALQKKPAPAPKEQAHGAKGDGEGDGAKKCGNDKPLAVIWQHADASGDPLSPLTLLMAYEAKGCVLPVVSDFDCFLMGTKRVSYEQAMPDYQLDLTRWCLSQIETILDAQDAPGAGSNNPGSSPNWTNCWLKVLQKAAKSGFHPEIPEFGFGDPKSYSIIEQAVSNLSEDGCVRHGPECFNYYFPQELDEEFLVISRSLPGNKVWAYMNPRELQLFLSDRIDDGYTFPLNPKWVLCDPGWKELYDKLLASDMGNIKESLGIWYPPDIRKQIETIHSRHPGGFGCIGGADLADRNKTNSEGTAAMDLAELQLKRHLTMERAKRKLRVALMLMMKGRNETLKAETRRVKQAALQKTLITKPKTSQKRRTLIGADIFGV
jgi:hypothetical protein